MNKNIIIASAVAAGAAALLIMVQRKWKSNRVTPKKIMETNPRHLTNMFANAKPARAL